ncbi:MAG TPA: hypothetical protein PLX53_07410, partial [Tenuifilaceae bacterium]|nr:hypothetical protein [Tenuifilaceae bacterium]
RMMKFDNLSPIENRTLDVVKKLVNLRRNTMALNYGNFETLLADSTQYAYARTYLQSSAIVVFNKSDEDKSIIFKLPDYVVGRNFTSKFGSNFSIQNQIVKVDLKPNSFEILISK